MMTKHADSLVDDLFTTKEETYEKPLFMENEEELIEMGFNTKIASHYVETSDKKLIFKNYPANHFFDWYLGRCTKQMLETLKEYKNRFRENQVKKLMSYEIKEESFKKPDMNTIEAYIEKNAELIQKNIALADKLITANHWITHHEEVAEKYQGYAKFLYDFMGNLEFNGFRPTTDDLFKLQKIKEDMKNV